MVTDLLEWRKLKKGIQERGFPPSPLLLPKSCVLSHFSRVWLFATPWTIACQAPLSRGFSRQEYQSGYSFPALEDLYYPGTEPESLISPALAGMTTSTTWKACRKATQPKEKKERASPVVQLLRVSLAMQGTPVWSLVREDPSCLGPQPRVPQLLSLCSRAQEPQLLNTWATTTATYLP